MCSPLIFFILFCILDPLFFQTGNSRTRELNRFRRRGVPYKRSRRLLFYHIYDLQLCNNYLSRFSRIFFPQASTKVFAISWQIVSSALNGRTPFAFLTIALWVRIKHSIEDCALELIL